MFFCNDTTCTNEKRTTIWMKHWMFWSFSLWLDDGLFFLLFFSSSILSLTCYFPSYGADVAMFVLSVYIGCADHGDILYYCVSLWVFVCLFISLELGLVYIVTLPSPSFPFILEYRLVVSCGRIAPMQHVCVLAPKATVFVLDAAAVWCGDDVTMLWTVGAVCLIGPCLLWVPDDAIGMRPALSSWDFLAPKGAINSLHFPYYLCRAFRSLPGDYTCTSSPWVSSLFWHQL